jgi:hypothetical protein
MIARLSVPFRDLSRNCNGMGAVFSRWFAGFERIPLLHGVPSAFGGGMKWKIQALRGQ